MVAIYVFESIHFFGLPTGTVRIKFCYIIVNELTGDLKNKKLEDKHQSVNPKQQKDLRSKSVDILLFLFPDINF